MALVVESGTIRAVTLEPTPVYTNRLQCVECGRVSRENERGWTARLTVDDEVAVYCPECDEPEFGHMCSIEGRRPRRSVPADTGRENRMGAFLYRLEQADGTAADPPTLRTAVPTWNAGDTIPLGGRTLRVIDTRLDEGTDGDPVAVLVVESA